MIEPLEYRKRPDTVMAFQYTGQSLHDVSFALHRLNFDFEEVSYSAERGSTDWLFISFPLAGGGARCVMIRFGEFIVIKDGELICLGAEEFQKQYQIL